MLAFFLKLGSIIPQCLPDIHMRSEGKQIVGWITYFSSRSPSTWWTVINPFYACAHQTLKKDSHQFACFAHVSLQQIALDPIQESTN